MTTNPISKCWIHDGFTSWSNSYNCQKKIYLIFNIFKKPIYFAKSVVPDLVTHATSAANPSTCLNYLKDIIIEIIV